MKNLEIAIIKSSFENLKKLNDRIYFEVERDGYLHLTTEMDEGILCSLFIFNNLKNKTFLETILSGYEYLNGADIYFGKVEKMNEYVAEGYTGRPKRIKVLLDNGDIYDVPQEAKTHLKIEL